MGRLAGQNSNKGVKEAEKLVHQLQNRFVGFWQRLAEPLPGDEPGSTSELVQEYLSNLKERAYLERTIANQYRGRFLLELLQNAVDAMHKHASSAATTHKAPKASPNKAENGAQNFRCHIELTPYALYVANDGEAFEPEDLRGIVAMGQSTKPAGEYIGYKGLGFRSVLEISDTPEIYSGPYQFGFSRIGTLALLAERGVESDLLEGLEIPALSVPLLKAVDSPELPESERAILSRLGKAGFSTIIRLPLKPRNRLEPENDVFRVARLACQELATSRTLLFLPNITELSVKIPGETPREPGSIITISKTAQRQTVKPENLQEQARVSRLTFKREVAALQAGNLEATPLSKKLAVSPDDSTSSISREDWLLVETVDPVAIEPLQLVTELEDSTWQKLKEVNLALAFPLARMPWGGGNEVFLKRGREALPFFAHFPTQESSGLGFAVHADFYLSASRKSIEWSVPYNRWLAGKLAEFICGPALDVIHFLYPDEAALVEILMDNTYFNDSFGRSFRKTLDERLASTSFIPTGNGQYRAPGRVVWTPLQQEGVLIFRRVFRSPGPNLNYPVLQLEEVHSAAPPVPKDTRLFSETERLEDRLGNLAGFFDDPGGGFDALADHNFNSSSRSYTSLSREYGNYDRVSPTEYDRDPYSPSYDDYDPYFGSDDAPTVGKDLSGPVNKQIRVTEEVAEFDYGRIRRFLSSLGVETIPVALLPKIFGQTLRDWETGLILTTEICTALALWFDQLNREEAAAGRQLIEFARQLPVLPTVEAGWQPPNHPQFRFRDAGQNSSLSRFFINEREEGGSNGTGFHSEDEKTILLIQPAAYELPEYVQQIRRWFQALGVSSTR